MSLNGGLPAPTTYQHEERPQCRRGCCWTPYPGLCPKARHCPCHLEES